MGTEAATYEAMPKCLEKEIQGLAIKHGLDWVILFGSRAHGDFHRTSDIDLAISGGNTKLFALEPDEETHTLLRFDCVDLGESVCPELRASIEPEGKVLYAKA